MLLRNGHGVVWLGFLVVLFAENGICRAVVESLSGAEAAALAPEGGVGAALGAFDSGSRSASCSWPWRELDVGAVRRRRDPAAAGGRAGAGRRRCAPDPRDGWAKQGGRRRTREDEDAMMSPNSDGQTSRMVSSDSGSGPSSWRWSCTTRRTRPGASTSGSSSKRDLHAPERMLAYAFAVSIVAWLLVVRPAGWLADRWGRQPLLVAGGPSWRCGWRSWRWCESPWLAVANQALDGLGNGLFAVVAAAWVSRSAGRPEASGEAQVIVGSSLVFGSAMAAGSRRLSGRSARLPRAVCGPGGPRRESRRDRVALVPETLARDANPATAWPANPWPRRRTSRRPRDGGGSA